MTDPLMTTTDLPSDPKFLAKALYGQFARAYQAVEGTELPDWLLLGQPVKDRWTKMAEPTAKALADLGKMRFALQEAGEIEQRLKDDLTIATRKLAAVWKVTGRIEDAMVDAVTVAQVPGPLLALLRQLGNALDGIDPDEAKAS